MIAKTPSQIANIIKFACLTGLRPTEAIESVRLLNSVDDDRRNYYNPERQALEHFRFPEIFLRQTKKAYISFVSPEILEIIRDIGRCPSYNAIRRAIYKKGGIKCDMAYCRKIFASYLRQSAGIESEIVDLLQGRVPRTVFARHYFTPSLDYRAKVLCALDKLRRDIDER
jgi:intergrase/recombinase